MIEKRETNKQTETRRDMLACLLEVHDKNESKLNMGEVVGITTANIIAGSDTTAIGLRSVLYYLCKNPHFYKKLQREVDEAFEIRTVRSPVNYADANKLEYLNAVVNEALRVHSPAGLPLERELPEGGVTIAGTFIPAGTFIGINPWVLHRDKSVFGEDAESFNPERWLEGSEEKISQMKRCNMTFGAGPRVYIGRHISPMETLDLVPELMRRYDFRLVQPEKEWKVLGQWFTKQTELDMYFTKREV
ncbi:MAG: hypothetical protein M1821_000571 [Bathelium mastoideum]|nr:MAG: hypothetical protein M1821_000571 [Bathelium mastoideum]